MWVIVYSACTHENNNMTELNIYKILNLHKNNQINPLFSNNDTNNISCYTWVSALFHKYTLTHQKDQPASSY